MWELAYQEKSDTCQSIVLGILDCWEEKFCHAVFLELRGWLDQVDQRFGWLFFDGLVGDDQDLEDGVEVPSSVDGMFFNNQAYF